MFVGYHLVTSMPISVTIGFVHNQTYQITIGFGDNLSDDLGVPQLRETPILSPWLGNQWLNVGEVIPTTLC